MATVALQSCSNLPESGLTNESIAKLQNFLLGIAHSELSTVVIDVPPSGRRSLQVKLSRNWPGSGFNTFWEAFLQENRSSARFTTTTPNFRL